MAMTREQKIDAARGGKLFARGDIAVYLAVLCLLALFTAFAFLLRAPSGDRFIVYWQGDAVFSAPLAEDAAEKIETEPEMDLEMNEDYFESVDFEEKLTDTLKNL